MIGATAILFATAPAVQVASGNPGIQVLGSFCHKMTITKQFLPDFVLREPFDSIPVRNEDGKYAFSASMERACVLIELGIVEGRGSRSHLRYLQLLVPERELESRTSGGVQQMEKNLRLTIGERRDALMKMISSQTTVFRERIVGKSQCFMVFAFKRLGSV